jgi:hypothetical protein
MIKKYLYISLLLFGFSLVAVAQDGKNQSSDVLGFYPNPVTNGKIYITSKTTLEREISIYDVLGKRVFITNTSNKELNISTITPGVYLIKIKEADVISTRKLIVR